MSNLMWSRLNIAERQYLDVHSDWLQFTTLEIMTGGHPFFRGSTQIDCWSPSIPPPAVAVFIPLKDWVAIVSGYILRGHKLSIKAKSVYLKLLELKG